MQNRTALVLQLCVCKHSLEAAPCCCCCAVENLENVHATTLEPNLSQHGVTLVKCSPYGVPLLGTIRSPQTLRQMLF